MLKEDILVRVRWGPRPEAPEKCAGRIRRCLEDLRSIHEIFATWHEKRNKPVAASPVSLDGTTLTDLVRKGAYRNDVSGHPVSKLGYLMFFWNGGARHNIADITFQCGASSPRVGNRALLRIRALAEGIDTEELLEAALKALTGAFQPQVGEIFQIVTDGEDLLELHCGGIREVGDVTDGEHAMDRVAATIWFDRQAYQNFR